MRRLVVSQFLVASLICISSNSYSQKPFLLRGAIKERGTKNPIPYANLWVLNSTTGTATDINGEFVFTLDHRHIGKKIQVSCIGYKTKFFPVDSLISIDQININLETDASLLDEVVIKAAPINPRQIIEKAVASISENYLTDPFNLEYYSQIVATEYSTNKEYKLETILLGYSQGYSIGKRNFFEVTQKRTTGEDHLSHLDYQYWPGYEIHAADLISNPRNKGILGLKNLDKFEIKYSGVSLFDEDTVLSIEYSLPKPTKEITGYGIVPATYKGVILIATGTNAIIKHEIAQINFLIQSFTKRLKENISLTYFTERDDPT